MQQWQNGLAVKRQIDFSVFIVASESYISKKTVTAFTQNGSPSYTSFFEKSEFR